MKFIQDKVQQLRDGKIAVSFKSTDTLERLQALMAEAFPSAKLHPMGGSAYYEADGHTWIGEISTQLPSYPLWSFFEDELRPEPELEPTPATTAVVTHIDRAAIATQIYCAHIVAAVGKKNMLPEHKVKQTDLLTSLAVEEAKLLIQKLTQSN